MLLRMALSSVTNMDRNKQSLVSSTLCFQNVSVWEKNKVQINVARKNIVDPAELE